MKRLNHLIFILAICGPGTASAVAPQNAEPRKLLQQLFPSASSHVVNGWFGASEMTEVFYPISLRNRYGLIRVPTAKIQPLGETYTALAFEILLASDKDARRLVSANAPHNPPGAMKLLQLVIFDNTAGEFIGKPQGFPIEATSWTCTGDICSTVSLLGFADVQEKEPFVILEYSTGLQRRFVMAVAMTTNRKPLASQPTAVGDLGGESGCHVNVSFTSYSMDKEGVSAVRHSQCDPDCPEICTSRSLPSGKSQRKVLLLSLGSAHEQLD